MKFKITLITFFCITTIIFGVHLFDQFGGRMKKEDEKKYIKSSNFDVKTKTFISKIPLINTNGKKNSKFRKLIQFFNDKKNCIPQHKLPAIKPNLKEFLSPSNQLKVIWLGHSSLIIRINEKTILVDPVFSSTASPLPFMIKRFQQPPMDINELPEIDVILITHDHYDHLDKNSIQFFKNKRNIFVTPIALGMHLKKWGIKKDRIKELDWWENYIYKNIEFIATPSLHYSSRVFGRKNKTLWASFVVKTKNNNIFISGDGGYGSHFKTIGEKYGPFDIAFIESGQYNISWKNIHLMPNEWEKTYKDLKAKRYFPTHYGMFYLSPHPWNEPLEKLYEMSKLNKINLITPVLGEITHIGTRESSKVWWRQ
ncbi:MAG: MBL fold metallo-hydrolase [Bacteroidales bacterium]